MATMWKRFSDFLGISDPEFIRAPPLDGEIIYCKNNVCVHPPPQLTTLPKHLPGYLTIRTHGSGYINTSLVLTWIPNFTLNTSGGDHSSVVSTTSESSPLREDVDNKCINPDVISEDSAFVGTPTEGFLREDGGGGRYILQKQTENNVDYGLPKKVLNNENESSSENNKEQEAKSHAENGRRGSTDSRSTTSGDLATEEVLSDLLKGVGLDQEDQLEPAERPDSLEFLDSNGHVVKEDDSMSSASDDSTDYPEPFKSFLRSLNASDHMTDTSPVWMHNMSFPENAVALFSNGHTVPMSNPREQLCGVFAVDLCHMRSLRIFFTDESCTSGQFVIASRESQYKILHFHHSGLDKLAEVFEHWQHCIQSLNKEQPGGEGSNLFKKFTIIQSGMRANECHPEEGIYSEVTLDVWRSYVNEKGQVEEPYGLRKAIFFAGIEKSLRAEVWPFLLGMFDFSSTEEERLLLEKQMTVEYEEIKRKRASMNQEEQDRFWKQVRCTVEKDVIRTDRSKPFFQGKNNKNIDMMCNILLNYAVYCPSRGYNQGMSDLLAPLMVELQNECESFWCFASLMQNVNFVCSPKDEDMESQLTFLRALIKLMLPEFWAHLDTIQNSMELLFCHRWILLCFKREFTEEEATRMWEACWAHYQTDYFHLFICLAIIAIYGDDVVQQNLSADDMLLHFSNLSMQMNGTFVLRKARAMLHKFRTLQRIPCSLDKLCVRCGTGMWDSGHSPEVECIGSHEEGYHCVHIR